MDTYLGIDYGGTKLLIGEVEEGGKLIHFRRYETGLADQRSIAAHLMECLEDYQRKEKLSGNLKGAGIGIVGISDFHQGIWQSVDHGPGEPIPLAAMVSKRLGIPAGVDNDVKSATAAEMLWGIGKECRDFIYVNAGTGLAAGLVAGGELIRGVSNDAGEIGHMVIDRNSPKRCVCGRRGCGELSASGIGIHKKAAESVKERRTRLKPVGEGERYSVAEIFALAREGDLFCRELAEDAVDTLSCTVMNLVRVTDPELVILGGGLVTDSWFFEKVKECLDPVTMRHVNRGVTLSRFDPAFSGVTGAAAVGCLKAGHKNQE